MTSPSRSLPILLALVAAVQCQSISVIPGFENGVNGVRDTVQGLVNLADDGVSVAQKKVREEYVPWLELEWRKTVKQAVSATGADGEVVTKCSAADPIAAILEEVRAEAEQCVAERVPPGQPFIRDEAKRILANCDQFMTSARAVAQRCDSQAFFQGAMCLATQLAPMGGRIGILGGQAGQLGGSVARLIDGSARSCVKTASGWRSLTDTGTGRDAKAREAAAAIAECIRSAAQP